MTREEADGPTSLDEISELYRPASHYALRPNRYPAGASFVAAGKATILHVLSGNCAIGIGPQTFQLEAGASLQVPEGEYTFKVVGHEPVEVVKVFHLPEIL